MNRLLHRLIPTLMILLLPFTLLAEEIIEAETLRAEVTAQTPPESSADETAAEATTEEVSPAPSLMEEKATASETVEGNEATEETSTTVAAEEAVAPVDDGTFAITTFEIEGNLLLSTEKIEQALQGYIGEGKSRDDLFSIRYTIIKAYRKAELPGVAVAVPTTGEAGLLQIRVFEDDIVDVYPQQSKKAAAKEATATASQAAPTETETATKSSGPQTFAIKTYPAEKPAVIVRKQAPEPLPRIEDRAPTEMAEQAASPATDEETTTLAAASVETATEPLTEAVKEPAPQEAPPSTEKLATPTPVISRDEKPATALVEPVAETSVDMADTAPPAVEEAKAKEAVAQAATPPATKKMAEMKKEITPPAANKTAVVAKREVVRPKKAAAKAAPNSATDVDEEIVSATAIDAKQAAFKVASFKIYGNSLIKTEAIEKLLESYLGPDKTHEDLADARLEVSKLYRDQGYKMVAISMPSKIFSEAIPVRIYEAKRR